MNGRGLRDLSRGIVSILVVVGMVVGGLSLATPVAARLEISQFDVSPTTAASGDTVSVDVTAYADESLDNSMVLDVFWYDPADSSNINYLCHEKSVDISGGGEKSVSCSQSFSMPDYPVNVTARLTFGTGGFIDQDETEVTLPSNEPSILTLSTTSTGDDWGTVYGELESLGTADSVDTWVEYREEGSFSWQSTSKRSRGSAYLNDYFPRTIDGLQPATTYEYRFAAENSHGVDRGTTRTFTTDSGDAADSPPSVTTGGVPDAGQTYADLEGTVDSFGGATDVDVYWELREQGASTWDERGRRQTSSGGTHSNTVSNLDPGTTYEYRFVAVNSQGSDTGTVRTFTTDAATTPPSVTTDGSREIDTTGALLDGVLEAVGTDTSATVYFEYREQGTSTWRTSGTESYGVSTGYGIRVENLDPGTTYEFRAVAENSAGTDTGATLTFSTKQPSEPPSVATAGTGSVGNDSAALSGDLRSLGSTSTATVWFEYRRQGASTWRTTDQVAYGSPATFGATASGLDPATTYEFRAVAENDVGTDRGDVLTFTTGEQSVTPTVSTGSANEVDTSGAVLAGTLEDLGSAAEATVSFEYRERGAATWQSTATERYTGATGYTVPVDGLATNSTYEYRAVAETTDGRATGFVRTFTTDSVDQPPTVLTNEVGAVYEDSAVLSGTLDDLGTESTATVWFEYRERGASTWRATDSAEYSSAAGFSDTVTGLSPNTTYEFRGVAESPVGTDRGRVATFSTAATSEGPAVTTVGATEVADSSVVLEGSLDALGTDDVARVWFEYRERGAATWQLTTQDLYEAPATVETTVTGLDPETTYEFRFAAKTTAGHDAGVVATVTTDAAATVEGSVDVVADRSSPAPGTELTAGEETPLSLRVSHDLSGADSGTIQLYFEELSESAAGTIDVSSGEGYDRVELTLAVPSDYSGDLHVTFVLRADGERLDADSVTYTVVPPGDNAPPTVDDIEPAETALDVETGTATTFAVEASDDDGDDLTYNWYVSDPDGDREPKRVATGPGYTHAFGEAGEVSVRVVVDDGTTTVERTWTATVAGTDDAPPALADAPPTDPDDDGVYEDVNGNGRADFHDLVLLADHLDDPATREHPGRYDVDGDGRLGFTDVAAMFDALFGGETP